MYKLNSSLSKQEPAYSQGPRIFECHRLCIKAYETAMYSELDPSIFVIKLVVFMPHKACEGDPELVEAYLQNGDAHRQFSN